MVQLHHLFLESVTPKILVKKLKIPITGDSTRITGCSSLGGQSPPNNFSNFYSSVSILVRCTICVGPEVPTLSERDSGRVGFGVLDRCLPQTRITGVFTHRRGGTVPSVKVVVFRHHPIMLGTRRIMLASIILKRAGQGRLCWVLCWRLNSGI